MLIIDKSLLDKQLRALVRAVDTARPADKRTLEGLLQLVTELVLSPSGYVEVKLVDKYKAIK